MRLVAAINTGLDAGLSVRTLFDAPTIAELAPRLGGEGGGLSRWWPVERPAVVPLSFAQSRLWFIDQLQGPSPVYNIATTLRISGALDVDALGAALADVVGRHESLRTLIAAPEGIPQQVVVPAERAEFGWDVVDATAWSADRLGEAIEETAASHVLIWRTRSPCGQGFSASPMTSTCWWAWCTTSPPTAGRSSRWCVISVWRMPAGVRAGRRSGRRWRCSTSITRCGSATQFGDLDDSDSRIGAQLAYWQDALAGMPERLQLPTDRPYPAVADHRGASVAVEWPAELQQRVREVAREHNATSFMVMQAALAVLLSRLSASSDVAVGFPIAGRNDPALDELIGFFVNTLVLRVDLAGDPTVAELLAQVRRRSLAAYEHQDVPFEVLVERLNPTRSMTHHPLVQVALDWQNWHDSEPATGLTLGGLQVTQIPVDTQTARMDLTFSLSEHFTEAGEPAGIDGSVEFRTDVFDAASIEALIERLRRVVAAMTTDPAQKLSSVDVLDGGERARLDELGNRAVLSRPESAGVSIPELFAEHVARRPEAVAITCGQRSWSYREVDETSNRLAQLMAVQGVGAGRCVALLLERSGDAVLAMLAVLKTGAAYLAIDPVLPDTRIDFMIADAAPITVITTAALRARLDGCDVAMIDIEDPTVDSQPSSALPAPAADDLAYIIYTSGTTGVPKGVAITHHNLTHLAESMPAHLPAEQVWTQCHSYAFDFSVWEIWAALLGGGRLRGRARVRDGLTGGLSRLAGS